MLSGLLDLLGTVSLCPRWPFDWYEILVMASRSPAANMNILWNLRLTRLVVWICDTLPQNFAPVSGLY